jgi:metallo-beta-lactamase class B
MKRDTKTKASVGMLAFLALAAAGPLRDASAQQAKAPELTPEQVKAAMAANPALFLKTARTSMKWDEAAEPVKVAGPIYFVGTQGLAAWLITGSEGDVLLNTCMENSGPLIETSIRKLGLDPKRIKWLLANHAHVDHVAGHAYIKKLTGAQVAVAAQEVGLLESGGKGDFNYDGVPGFGYEPVKVDRVLRDGDVVKLGDIALTARVTPGHNFGAVTWIMNVVDQGKVYNVVFPDGSGVNPGFRIVKNPSYPGIEGDYRRTLYLLSTLKPEIWLHSHTATMGFEAKRARVASEGMRAFVDPEGYRRWVAAESAAFEAVVDAELGVPKRN